MNPPIRFSVRDNSRKTDAAPRRKMTTCSFTMRHVVGALFAVSRDRSGVGGGQSGRVDFRQTHSTYK
jgi:hypothetical protein